MGYTEKYSGEYDYTKQQLVVNPTKHHLFSTWRSMNIRCYDSRHCSYHRYGGRGITVCKKWRWDNCEGFHNFVTDMGQRPEGMTLDRIDNDRGYCKENCKWSDKKQQQNNLAAGVRNSSGCLGVSYNKINNGWIVQLQLNNETHILGTFNLGDKDLAEERYSKTKEIKLTEGDDAAINFYRSLKKFTPTGKQIRRNKRSKYFGVSPKRDKWRAYTNEYVDGKLRQIHLGVYIDEESAYAAVIQRLEQTKE